MSDYLGEYLSCVMSCVFIICPPPQMQQQELAQMRQRDANLTALAAIGPRKKRKLDSPGGSAGGTEVRGSRPPEGAVFSTPFPFFFFFCS